MAKDVKAIIGLARGRVAFFEPVSNVMLDLANPVAYIYEGTDTSRLRSALGGAIYVISGNLFEEVVETAAKVEAPAVKQEAQPAKAKVEIEEPKEVKAEPAKEEVVEVKAEKPEKKTTKTKKAKSE